MGVGNPHLVIIWVIGGVSFTIRPSSIRGSEEAGKRTRPCPRHVAVGLGHGKGGCAPRDQGCADCGLLEGGLDYPHSLERKGGKDPNSYWVPLTIKL